MFSRMGEHKFLVQKSRMYMCEAPLIRILNQLHITVRSGDQVQALQDVVRRGCNGAFWCNESGGRGAKTIFSDGAAGIHG